MSLVEKVNQILFIHRVPIDTFIVYSIQFNKSKPS